MTRHINVVPLQALVPQAPVNNKLREPGNEASISHVQPHITVYGCVNACDPNCRKICVLVAYTMLCYEHLDSPPFVVSINVVNIFRH